MDIDFVISWVNGNDPDWQKQKNKHLSFTNDKSDTNENRYRDWENLQYWFRGVEEYAPWVRKIHFVTWGHIPEWLNVDHPKLNIVKHEDFIPGKFLPTFSSRPIEINLHKIDDLSDKFVYFNDDMFLLKETTCKTFFNKGLPNDVASLEAITPTGQFSKILMNNVYVINKYFNKQRSIKDHKYKWFNLSYGKELYKTMSLYPWNEFTGFFNPHLPLSYSKSTFLEVWDKESKLLDMVSSNKFRSADDVNSWLFRYWRLAKGDFYPKKYNGKYYSITSINECKKCANDIENQKHEMICINDVVESRDVFNECKKEINRSFEKTLSSKSTYEI